MAQGLLWADQDLRRELAAQGLTLRSVPEAGRRIRVKRVINDNRAEDNETASLCPAAVESGRRAVAEIGLRLAGVDVITPDPSLPLDEARGAVIEVNATPGFYYHYHKKEGRLPVARHVLERALADSRR
jgi:cyanophycin synthetase